MARVVIVIGTPSAVENREGENDADGNKGAIGDGNCIYGSYYRIQPHPNGRPVLMSVALLSVCFVHLLILFTELLQLLLIGYGLLIVLVYCIWFDAG